MRRQKKVIEKNEAAVALGSLGGKVRAKRLSSKRRKEIAEVAAKARWAKKGVNSDG